MARVLAFIDFGAGVVALLLLTFTVMWGVVAADRFILDPGHRLIAQADPPGHVRRRDHLPRSAHLVEDHARVDHLAGVGGALPDGAQPILIGLGTIAGYLFLGRDRDRRRARCVRAQGQSRLWRALHMTAYIAWGGSLVHGLRAGRAVADYVDGGYAVCLTGVTVVLMMRLARLAAARSPSKKEQR